MNRREIFKGAAVVAAASIIPALPAIAAYDPEEMVYVMFRPARAVNYKTIGTEMILLNVEKDHRPNWKSLYGEITFCRHYLHIRNKSYYSSTIEKMKRSEYELMKMRAAHVELIDAGVGKFYSRKWVQEHIWRMPVDNIV